MIKRFFLCSVLLSILGLLFGCQQLHESQERLREWMKEDGRIKVLCTTVYVGEIVRAVGQDDVDVLDLISGQNDPHSYQLVKGDNDKFLRAEIVFCSGLGLEQGASIRRRLRVCHACYLGDEINAVTGLAISIGPTKDPHMWLDVGLWAKGARIVAEKLSALRPERSQEFQRRALVVESRLNMLDNKIRSFLQSVHSDRRYLVATHDAFHYFCRAYLSTDEERLSGRWQERCMAPEGLSPDSQISTQDLTSTVAYIMRHRVPVIFSECGMNKDAIQTIVDICRKKGFIVSIAPDPLYSDTMIYPVYLKYRDLGLVKSRELPLNPKTNSSSRTGIEGLGTYESTMWYNAKTVDRFLRESSL